MFSPGEVKGFQEQLGEDKESQYALWLETFYSTNPKTSSTSQGVLATILQRPTPPAQRKVHTHQQVARVLTSELCIQQLEEKATKKKEKQEEKERRKAERERKRQEKVEASKVKKSAKNKGTAQFSKTACSAYTHRLTIIQFCFLCRIATNCVQTAGAQYSTASAGQTASTYFHLGRGAQVQTATGGRV